MTDEPIVDIAEARRKKELEKLMGEIKNSPGFPNDVDLTNTTPHFDGCMLGGKNDAELHLFVHDVSSGTGVAIGAIRFTPTQWEEFRKLGDMLVEAHTKLLDK